MELSQSLAACKGRTEAARAAADAAAEKLAACRRELEGIERQRAEAEAIISAARPNVESFEARLAELDEQLAATKRKQAEAQGQLQPIRREAHQVSDNLAEAKLAAVTLVERTAYAERVRDARARDLESLAAQSSEATAQLRVKTVSAARIEPLARPLRGIGALGPALDPVVGRAGHGGPELFHGAARFRHRGPGASP